MRRLLPVFLSAVFAFALASAFGGASCYSPAIDDCQYACAPPKPGQAQCPEGFFCNSELRCVSAIGMRCDFPPQIDAPIGGDIKPDIPGDSSTMPDITPVSDAGSGSGSG